MDEDDEAVADGTAFLCCGATSSSGSDHLMRLILMALEWRREAEAASFLMNFEFIYDRNW